MKRLLNIGSKGKGKEKAKTIEAPLPNPFSYLENRGSQTSVEPSTLRSSRKKLSVGTSFTLSSFSHEGSSRSGYSLPGAPVSLAETDSLPDLEEYSFLQTLKTVFVIDNSPFMASAWEETSGILQKIVPVCAQYDEDGIDVAFPNTRGRFQHVRTAHEVKTMFRKTETSGTTPIGESLCMILRSYLQSLGKEENDEHRSLNVVVIIGGIPTDESPYFELKNVLERTATRLQRMDLAASQISIQFFQMGYEHEVANMLHKLHDMGKDGIFVRDIVDSHTFRVYDGTVTREVILDAIEERIGRARKGKGKS